MAKHGLVAVPILILSYIILCLRIKEVKRRAWILTTLAACFVAPRALILHCKYAFPGLGFNEKKLLQNDEAAEMSICFFVWYLICDCVVGFFFYSNMIGFLEGWIHHTFYIGYYLYVMYAGCGIAASITFAIETPQIILGLGHVFPRLRADRLFGVVFFQFRILYHFWLGLHWLYLKHPLQRLWPIIFSLLGLHLHWFFKWITGLRTRLARLSSSSRTSEVQHTAISEERGKSVPLTLPSSAHVRRMRRQN
uniref:TLC domain-containing protein n=1 Tax=Aureoumbra lagunensis TaxID=44058 RepID=A0A7S3JT00_9STRA